MSDPRVYIPPHRRSIGTGDTEKRAETDQHSVYVPPYRRRTQPRRRDLSQVSKFNNRTVPVTPESEIKTEPKTIAPELIQIPEAVVPPIVEPVRLEKPKSHKYFVPDHEVEFIHEMALLREQQQQKQSEKEFNEWADHYEADLAQMYDRCVDPRIRLSYDQFVNLAYQCTAVEFNGKKLKYTRPLI